MKNFFSENIEAPLAAVTNNIVVMALPEKVFLLSVIHRVKQAENIYFPAMLSEQSVASLLLLVLAAESESRSANELQDIIEHRTGHPTDVSAFVMGVHEFNNWLMKDHPFAVKVYHEACLSFDAGITPLAIPNEYNDILAKDTLRPILDVHLARGIEFMTGGSLFIARKQYALAAFHLHQAAEQLYSGVIQFATGLRVHTHNLDKLHRYAQHLIPGLDLVFPRNTTAEKELFHCLQRAYVDGRYNEAFTIRFTIVSQLTERIQKLLELCKTLQHTKISHT